MHMHMYPHADIPMVNFHGHFSFHSYSQTTHSGGKEVLRLTKLKPLKPLKPT